MLRRNQIFSSDWPHLSLKPACQILPKWCSAVIGTTITAGWRLRSVLIAWRWCASGLKVNRFLLRGDSESLSGCLRPALIACPFAHLDTVHVCWIWRRYLPCTQGCSHYCLRVKTTLFKSLEVCVWKERWIKSRKGRIDCQAGGFSLCRS